MLKTERRTAQTYASKEQALSRIRRRGSNSAQVFPAWQSMPDLKILNEQKETACDDDDDDDDAATPIFFPFLPSLSLRFPSVLSFLSFLPEINELQMSGWMLPRSRSYC